MEKTKNFTELIVWQKAHQLVLEIYQLTNDFPRIEVYGLTSQFRRAAVSIPANIAGGSLEEVRYYCILSKDLKYANTESLTDILNEIGKLLSSYMKAINNSNS